MHRIALGVAVRNGVLPKIVLSYLTSYIAAFKKISKNALDFHCGSQEDFNWQFAVAGLWLVFLMSWFVTFTPSRKGTCAMAYLEGGSQH